MKLLKTIRTPDLWARQAASSRPSYRRSKTPDGHMFSDDSEVQWADLQNEDEAEKRRRRTWWNGRPGTEVPDHEDSGTSWHPSCGKLSWLIRRLSACVFKSGGAVTTACYWLSLHLSVSSWSRRWWRISRDLVSRAILLTSHTAVGWWSVSVAWGLACQPSTRSRRPSSTDPRQGRIIVVCWHQRHLSTAIVNNWLHYCRPVSMLVGCK